MKIERNFILGVEKLLIDAQLIFGDVAERPPRTKKKKKTKTTTFIVIVNSIQ